MNNRDPLGHGMRLVRWIAQQESSEVRVRQAAAALDMQPSTVSRLLTKLCEEGLVRRDARTGGYALGLELARLGYLASQRLDVKAIGHPYLRSVAQHCNETVTLGLYDRDRRQCLRIDQIPTSHPLNYVVRLDEWTDICHGASGLSIMAFLPTDEQEYHLALAESLARPESPWLYRRNLEPEIAGIRRDGYACTHGRRLVGAVGLGAPIYGMGERVIGSLVVSIPEVRWHLHDEADLAHVVKDAAAGITSMMAGRR